MLSPSLRSLADLCCIRIAYLMWTRRDVTKKCQKEVLFDELVGVVLADVEGLQLPAKLKTRVLKQVKPAGKHLLSVLSLWLSNKLPDDSEKRLTSDVFFGCLILNADGLINQRRTAGKLLSSRMLHSWFAFRLACINFLEKEVLKLWILVKEYFLNKIVLEGVEANAIVAQIGQKTDETCVDLTDHYFSYYIRKYPPAEDDWVQHPFPFTTEPDEVLFWVAYCLSRENAICIWDLPHYLGDDIDWYKFSLEFAYFSSNVAYFDYYLENFHSNECCRGYMIEKMLQSTEKDLIQPSFVLFFLLLNAGQKANLLRYDETIYQFLQWPLSFMSVENPEEFWNSLSAVQKVSIFPVIFYTLFNENAVLLALLNRNFDRLPISQGTFSLDHLAELWVELWKFSSKDDKSYILDECIFTEIGNMRGQEEFLTNFVTSGLKDMLMQLFISNGEAVLELFEKENMKESLRSIVSKHMSEHFEDLDRRCIQFLKTPTERLEDIIMEMKEVRSRHISRARNNGRCNIVYPKYEKFLNYIQEVLFSSS